MNQEDLKHAEDFRDQIRSVNDEGKRRWMYVLQPSGRFYNWRNYTTIFYLILFFGLPFIKMGGHPFILLNVVEGKFILFGKIFWPQDFFIFAVAMITFIVFISFFTVIYGRLFCGWACPQTIFMEMVFRKIEWWIEGSPGKQRQLNEQAWNAEKIIRKGVKHFVFLLISFLIANTFLAYIIGVDELYKTINEPISENWGLLVNLLLFTLVFYTVFAYIREIVCTTICPYGRLQSVLFDRNTMLVAYDYSRGEERGKIKKGITRTEGDCVDCKKCVLVCPTGIDIRDGVQMDCVACTACIDACDEVMDKVGFERGLIRYASENELAGGEKFKLNNRSKAYMVLLALLMGFMGYLIFSQRTIDSYVKKAQGQLFQEFGEDKLGNLYIAKIINKSLQAEEIELRLENHKGEIKFIGKGELVLKPESINDFEFFIILDNAEVRSHKTNIELGVYNKMNERIQLLKTSFLGPYR